MMSARTDLDKATVRCGIVPVCKRIAKWFPVLFLVGVITWGYYAFVIEFCLVTVQGVWLKVLLIVIYHIVLILFVWSFYQSIYTNPCLVPRKFQIHTNLMEGVKSATSEHEISEILDTMGIAVQTRTNTGQIRYCEICQVIKPDRSHHCSTCGTCVLKMDHHCPWVNNCVGFHNYKFFLLLALYSMIYCVGMVCISFKDVILFLDRGFSTEGKIHFVAGFIVSFFYAASLFGLLCYHIFYLLPNNRTTLEASRAPVFPHGPTKDGFHLGVINNFVQVFGEDKKKWLFPVFTSLGDGISFQNRNSCKGMNENGNADAPITGYNSLNRNPPDQCCFEVKVEVR